MATERSREPLVPRDELEAALGARRDLGPEYEEQIAAALAERIEERLEAHLRERQPARRPRDSTLPLAVLSLAISIPLIAIAGATAGLAGIVVVCAAIVLVNALAARA